MANPSDDSSDKMSARRPFARTGHSENFRVTIHARQRSSLSPELEEILKSNDALRDSVDRLRRIVGLLRDLHSPDNAKAVETAFASLSPLQHQAVDRDLVLNFGTRFAIINAELKRQCLELAEEVVGRDDRVVIQKDNIPLVEYLRNDHTLLDLEKKRLQHHLDEAARICLKNPDLRVIVQTHPLFALAEPQETESAASAFAATAPDVSNPDALIAEVFGLPTVAPKLWPGRLKATESTLEFTAATYRPWLTHPLMSITLLRDLDRNLYQALRAWLAIHEMKELPTELKQIMQDGPAKITLKADAVVIKYGIKQPSDAYEVFRGDKKTADRVSAHMRNHEDRLKALRRRYHA